MIYTILSSQPAPERDITIFDLEEFIEICDFNLDNLKDWFENHRYEAEISQGEEYFKESIFKEIQLQNESKIQCEIPVKIELCSTHTFEEEVDVFKRKLKNRQILIQGEMHWTSGNWNSFSIELDENEKFDSNKIKGEGYLGMVIGYSYDDREFDKNEDWMLNEGHISLKVYMNINDQLVELDLNTVERYLEKNSIEVSVDNTDKILKSLEGYFKNKKEEKKIIDNGVHRTYFSEERYPAGLLYQEGFLKNGKWDGLSKVYHPNGELNMEGRYKEGVKIGHWKVYSKTTPYLESQGLKGFLFLEIDFKNDYSQDEFNAIQDNKLDGLKDGWYKRYYANGKIDEEGLYRNNEKVGVWKKYSYDGVLSSEENY